MTGIHLNTMSTNQNAAAVLLPVFSRVRIMKFLKKTSLWGSCTLAADSEQLHTVLALKHTHVLKTGRKEGRKEEREEGRKGRRRGRRKKERNQCSSPTHWEQIHNKQKKNTKKTTTHTQRINGATSNPPKNTNTHKKNSSTYSIHVQSNLP
jgi:hypothetical protein